MFFNFLNLIFAKVFRIQFASFQRVFQDFLDVLLLFRFLDNLFCNYKLPILYDKNAIRCVALFEKLVVFCAIYESKIVR